MGRKGKDKDVDHEGVIDAWLERDLSAAAAKGELDRAFEQEDLLQQIEEVLRSGRAPVVVGDAGVGKTALIHETIRRAHQGNGPRALEGKRVLQFSIQRRAAGLGQQQSMGKDMDDLIDALVEVGQDIVPFFRDLDLAYTFDLEPHLQTLVFRFPNVLLGEGARAPMLAMFEHRADLEQHYTMVNVLEPSYERTAKILDAWAKEQERRTGRGFTEGALAEGLHLAHRFLSRSRHPRKTIDLLGQAASVADVDTVTETEVIDRFCANHHVPRFLVDPKVPLNLADIERHLNRYVLGQPEAVRSVAQIIGVVKAGLADMRRPFGVLLFVGPTGVGKTHIAQLLAEYLFGNRERMIRFNMADYQTERDALKLFGDPEDGRLRQMRGMFTIRLVGHPFAVLLLDEFEKAHPSVHDRFLQLADEGSYINGANETVSCRSMIIIATTNAGAEVYREQALGFSSPRDPATLDAEIDRRVAAQFRFEFLNRFDRVVHFHPLDRDHIRIIALREIEQLQQRAGLKMRGLTLEVDDSVLDWLTAHGYDARYGARFLRRALERNVTTAVAETIVRALPEAGSRIEVSVRGAKIVALVHSASEREREARTKVTVPVGTTQRGRTLDRAALLEEVVRTLGAAQPRLAQLAERQAERSDLLEQMNAPGFWEEPSENQQIVDRYRELDVAIQVEGRLAEPLRRLEEVSESASIQELGEAVEEAAGALHEWEERLAEEAGARDVWLVVTNADPLHSAVEWIETMTSMEFAWCRRLDLAVRVVAAEWLDENLYRIVLEVEGLGAGRYLEMEKGLHRMRRSQKHDFRARLDLVPRGLAPEPTSHRVTPARRRTGPFDLEIRHRVRVGIPDRGVANELFGESPVALAQLGADLELYWRDNGTETVELARAYGDDGSGARDPRTGAVAARMADVLRGDLDVFLEAWRRRPMGEPR